MSEDTASSDNRLDREFAAEDGATLSKSSLENESHPEGSPQSPAELAGKVGDEAAQGKGPIDTIKRALQEIDRDVSGEYEAREDDTAPR